MADYPDRAATDTDVSENLSIIQHAANLTLIHDNRLLYEENAALLAENESLLDGAAKQQARLEEAEYRNEQLLLTLATLREGSPA